MFIKPAGGRMVRMPGTLHPLSVDGETVLDNGYWRRLLRDGDVVRVDPSPVIPSVQARSPNQKKENENG